MNLFIMAKTVTRSIFKGPSTLMYPKKARVYTGIARGRIEIEIDKCIFCGMCGRKCPTGAIIVTREQREWRIDRLLCITCGACVEVCPKKCLAMHNHYSLPVTGREQAVYYARAESLPQAEKQE